MNRISTNQKNNDFQYHLKVRETALNRAQNQMADQRRIQNLRDDPVAAAHATRLQSVISRLNQFAKNSESVVSDLRIAEGYMNESVQIMHRINELAIQGANGTYAKDDLRVMGVEVDQLLNELITLANGKNGKGEPIFGGDRMDALPFRSLTGKVPGAEGQVVTNVDYIGTIAKNQAEITDGAYIQSNFPGNSVFWAENQQLYSLVDSQNFQVVQDSAIFVDGQEVGLKAGDNVYAVMAKINQADVSVKARLDPVTNGMILESTMPHQIWLQDAPGSKVLQDLGMLSGLNDRPPHNLSPDVRAFGGSLFEAVISVRDQMFEGNNDFLGTRGLAALQQASNNLISKVSDLGSRDSRLQENMRRLAYEIPEYGERNSKLVDLDITQGITDLKMLENTHKAALGAAGKMLQPTLMDFLR